MLEGDRKIRKIDDMHYEYINSIGEKFIIDKGDTTFYTIENLIKKLKAYYYEIDENKIKLTNCNINSFKIVTNANYDVAKAIACIKNMYTDIGKNPGSALILLNEYYKKYGYPKK